jgi:hypothetical protein
VRTLGRLAAPIVEEAQVQIRRKRAPEIESQSRPITQRRIELHRSYLTAPECQRRASLRYRHQGFELVVPWPSGRVDVVSVEAAIAAFHRRHERLYTFAQPDPGRRPGSPRTQVLNYPPEGNQMARGGARPGAGRPKGSKGLADTSRPLGTAPGKCSGGGC